MNLELEGLVAVLKEGFCNGAFSESPPVVKDVVRSCIRSTDLKLQKPQGYKVDTYLLHCTEVNGWAGLAFKIVPLHKEDLIRSAIQESTLMRQVGLPQNNLYSFPRFITFFRYKDHGVFIYQLLSGIMANDLMFDKTKVIKFAAVIQHVQEHLSATELGKKKLEEFGSSTRYYAPKLSRFLLTHLGMEVSEKLFEPLDILDTFKNRTPTVVSDRSPANFLIQKDGRLGVLDFGLVLAGTRYEDWSWFIDDPRLQSSLNRERLLQTFHEHQRMSGCSHAGDVTAFHLAAVFVCTKQYCVMKKTGRDAMADHYLLRAMQSAREISAGPILEVLNKVKTF